MFLGSSVQKQLKGVSWRFEAPQEPVVDASVEI